MKRGLGITFSIAVGTILLCVAYWRLAPFPFVQDDWDCLYLFRTSNFVSLLGKIFEIKGALFFRPAGILFLYFFYKLFKLSSLPYHLAALAIHTATAFIVTTVIRMLTKDRLVASITGLLYVSAFAIHLDCLLWIVGIFDLGGQFCFLLSLMLFIKGRHSASATIYAIGCLFKESVLILPVILAAYILFNPQAPPKPSLQDRAKKLFPFLLPMGIVLFLKLMGQSPLTLSSSHPYVFKIAGDHIFLNVSKYIAWMLQAVVPFQGDWSFYPKIGLLIVLAISIIIGIYKQDEILLRRLAFLIVWTAAPLLMVVFMPNHIYRYYAIYSIPAFLAVITTQIRYFLSALRSDPTPGNLILIFTTIGSLLCGHFALHSILNAGLSPHSFTDGTNLVRQAAIVNIVENEMKKRYPAIHQPMIFLFDDIDIWAFCRDRGPRVWYDTDQIQIDTLESVKCDTQGLYLEDRLAEKEAAYTNALVRKKYLEPKATAAFKLSTGVLHQISLEELKKAICR